MRLAVMQPYFFPYVGYFSLIAASDVFVVFDCVQYIRHGWINRNRILKPCFSEAQYINVPLTKHPRNTRIADVVITNGDLWKDKIKSQLQHYKKNAPCFHEVSSLLDDCLAIETKSIVDLNMHCLKMVCDFLSLDLNLIPFAEIESQVAQPNDAGEWAVNISIAMGAKAYINPIGGKNIFDAAKFKEHQIELKFIQNRIPPYSQKKHSPFVAGLSILDVLMFNGVTQTRKMVDNYEISTGNELSAVDK